MSCMGQTTYKRIHHQVGALAPISREIIQTTVSLLLGACCGRAGLPTTGPDVGEMSGVGSVVARDKAQVLPRLLNMLAVTSGRHISAGSTMAIVPGA